MDSQHCLADLLWDVIFENCCLVSQLPLPLLDSDHSSYFIKE